MDFNPHKPIYLQIADSLCDKILDDQWKREERIPSVRELGASMGVNPNTIVRVYDYLQNLDIIYNKRGIGYFVAANAKELILKQQRDQFLKEELPVTIKKMKLLDISLEDIEKLYNQL